MLFNYSPRSITCECVEIDHYDNMIGGQSDPRPLQHNTSAGSEASLACSKVLAKSWRSLC